MTTAARSTWEQVREGVLTCEQQLRVPVTGSPDLVAILDRLERVHFAEVERATFGVIRCHRRGAEIVCHVGERWPVLTFGAPETVVSATAAERRWPIRAGLLARPSAARGELILRAERGQEGQEVLLTNAVDGFPSRFLGDPLPGMPRLLWRLLSDVYLAYHRLVSFRGLERVACELRRETHRFERER
ncbi:MAG: hypothetical protein RMM58_03455 [Chloroflexota bacterium]|nr:hypothetical protein [Dehalococcoidia bacterium]MDW8252916.1 hypothetical protein [Chloroflexota bacterium]